jgi:ABC-2 type transport system ATP-binding protein
MGGFNTLKEERSLIQLTFPLGKANLADINRYCFDNGIVLDHLRLKRKSLETKFFELTNQN